MEKKIGKESSSSRREFLKKGAVGTALFGVPGLSAASSARKSDGPGQSLVGRRTYVGPDVDLPLPEAAEKTSSPHSADVAFFSSDSSLSRGKRRDFLENGSYVFFVGDGAEEAALSTLYDVSPGDVSKETLKNSKKQVKESFGFEYNPNPSYQVALKPSGGVLSKETFRSVDVSGESITPAHKQVNQLQILRNVDIALPARTNFATAAIDFGSVAYDTDEHKDSDGYIGSDSWTAIGEDTDRTGVYRDSGEHVGDIYKEVTCGYINDESDSDDDYWGWKTIQRITPNSDNGWDGTRMERDFAIDSNNLNNPEYIRQAPPEQTNETITLGVDVSSSGTTWSWSATTKEVEISQNFRNQSEAVNHVWDINGDAIHQSVEAHPGYEVETNNGETTQNYDFLSAWRFFYNAGSYSVVENHEIDSYAIWER